MNDVSKCKFESGIVPYMYGELAAHEATAFESHLLECTACTDEFAAISAARYEVYEWKKLEFEPLATPVIQIREVEPVSAGSWVQKLRAAFAGSWAVPGVAFAGLALGVGFAAFLILSGGGSGDVAKNTKNVPAINAAVPEMKAAAVPVAKDESRPEGTVAPQSHVERVSEPKRSQLKRSTRAVDRAPKAVPASTTATKAPKTPTLNDFDEEEDTSLRLAELFENIDTRE